MSEGTSSSASRRGRSASRSAASRSSTVWTSTPPAARSSPCSARTAPASRRSCGSSPATTPPIRARSWSTASRTRRSTRSPHARLGVRMIFQELSDAPALSVAENISLGRWPGGRGFVRWGAVRERAVRVLDQLGVDIDLDAPVVDAAHRRAADRRDRPRDLRRGALPDPRRADRRAVGAGGRAPLQASCGACASGASRSSTSRTGSTRWPQIADRVEVLRDGDVVLERDVAGATRARARVGDGRPRRRRRAPARAGHRRRRRRPAARFDDASSDGAFADVDLAVRPGEVVALYGKLGSGTGEVAESAFGLRPLTGGERRARGRGARPVARRTARSTPASGCCRPTASATARSWCARSPRTSRRRRGAASRAAGCCATAQRGARVPALARRADDPLAQRPRAADRDAVGRQPAEGAARPLAGARLARARADRADARRRRRRAQEIYRAVRKLAREGVAVLVATSDYEEVVQLADRAAVMARGRIVGELAGDEVTTERLTEQAGG